MSSPVLDEDGEYSGCVSVGDVLKGATKGTLSFRLWHTAFRWWGTGWPTTLYAGTEFVESFGPHYAENIGDITAEQLTEAGEDFTGKAVRAILHGVDLWSCILRACCLTWCPWHGTVAWCLSFMVCTCITTCAACMMADFHYFYAAYAQLFISYHLGVFT
jgi:hypothetical protein